MLSQDERIDLWLRERCTLDEAAFTLSAALYADFHEWALSKRLFVSSRHRVSRRLIARGFHRHQEIFTRRRGFLGLRLKRNGDGAGMPVEPPADPADRQSAPELALPEPAPAPSPSPIAAARSAP